MAGDASDRLTVATGQSVLRDDGENGGAVSGDTLVSQAGDGEQAMYLGSKAGHKTIRAAVDAAGADGTHSILDLEGVGVGEPPNTTPEHQLLVALGMVPGERSSFIAYQVPSKSVLKVFGRHLPTRAQFLTAEDALCADLRRRGSGFFLPLCDDAGDEVEVVFFGWTGD